MISLKNLVLLSTLLLLSAPLFSMPTHAQSVSPSVSTPPCGNIGDECPLSVSPSAVQGTVGSIVTVYVVVNDTIGLGHWRVQVQYDRSALVAIRVHSLNGNNIWDPQPPSQPTPAAWTSGGCYTGNAYDSHGTLLQASTPTTCTPITTVDTTIGPDGNTISCGVRPAGCVIVEQVVLGGFTDIMSTTGGSLFSIDFQVLAGILATPSSSTTIDLKSNIHYFEGKFIGGPFDNSYDNQTAATGKTLLLSPSNGQVLAIGSAALLKSKVNVAVHHLKLSSGNVQTLSATVGNTGTIPVNVRVDFVIVSEAGDVSFVSTGVLLMPVNTNGVISVSYTVPSLPLRYHVIGILTISANGISFVSSGDTATTAYSVVL